MLCSAWKANNIISFFVSTKICNENYQVVIERTGHRVSLTETSSWTHFWLCSLTRNNLLKKVDKLVYITILNSSHDDFTDNGFLSLTYLELLDFPRVWALHRLHPRLVERTVHVVLSFRNWAVLFLGPVFPFPCATIYSVAKSLVLFSRQVIQAFACQVAKKRFQGIQKKF